MTNYQIIILMLNIWTSICLTIVFVSRYKRNKLKVKQIVKEDEQSEIDYSKITIDHLDNNKYALSKSLDILIEHEDDTYYVSTNIGVDVDIEYIRFSEGNTVPDAIKNLQLTLIDEYKDGKELLSKNIIAGNEFKALRKLIMKVEKES